MYSKYILLLSTRIPIDIPVGVGEVVQHTDAVDKIIRSIEVCHVIQGHMVEVGIVSLPTIRKSQFVTHLMFAFLIWSKIVKKCVMCVNLFSQFSSVLTFEDVCPAALRMPVTFVVETETRI